MNRPNDEWVIVIKNKGYASSRFFNEGQIGRPIVKNRDRALVLPTNMLFRVDGKFINVLSHMRSIGVKKSHIEVRSADQQWEKRLGRKGWWDLFSAFS